MHKLHKPVAAISPSSLSENLLMQIAIILYTKHTNGQSHWIATTDFQTCGCISVISLPTPIKEQLFWSPQSGELSDEKRCCFISFSYSLPSDGKALKRRDRKKKEQARMVSIQILHFKILFYNTRASQLVNTYTVSMRALFSLQFQ